MFAGKTTRLMRYAEEAFDKGRKVVMIRSIQDKRNGPVREGLKTHDGRSVQRDIPELYCHTLGELFGVPRRFDFVCIDEGQFFSDITWTPEYWAQEKCTVIAAGIMMDHVRVPMPPMVHLMV